VGKVGRELTISRDALDCLDPDQAESYFIAGQRVPVCGPKINCQFLKLVEQFFRKTLSRVEFDIREENMGRGILLWLLGVPIPIIILLALFWH
jgi:hypothetical protein